MTEVTETSYYTVEYQAAHNPDLWLFAANDESSRELSEDEARKAVELSLKLGLGVRVHLHEQRISKQLVREWQAVA